MKVKESDCTGMISDHVRALWECGRKKIYRDSHLWWSVFKRVQSYNIKYLFMLSKTFSWEKFHILKSCIYMKLS